MILIHTLGLWFIYRAVMWLKRGETALRRKGGIVLIVAWFFVAIAYVLDMAYTLIWGTLMFLDLPRELTFTARLKRYQRDISYALFQRRLADFFCEELLNPYDPSGRHC